MNQLYRERIVYSFRKSIIKGVLLIALGCILYPFVPEAGSVIALPACGALTIVLWYYKRVRRGIKDGSIAKTEGGYLIKIKHGLEIKVPDNSPYIEIGRTSNGDLKEALLIIGTIRCYAEKSDS